ncbi:MAG: ABC transporter substrate-binding protein [Deltaproteobacteria bacterium]|nr:ABC transporter substrate-binding protein [Deltaproteobacteria bacterium]
MMKRVRFLLVVGTLVLSGAAAAAFAQTPKPGGTLTIGFKEEPDRLDARYPGRRFILFPEIYESLAVFGKNMSDIRPALAEKWEQPNPTTYVFYLRKGVKFHNGRELTADDIKTNIEWRSKGAPKDWPRMRNLEAMSKIKNVEVLDRYKIRITIDEPGPMMVTAFTGGDTGLPGIIPPEIAGKFMLGKGGTVPIGTGPFKVKEWVSGSHITLERFADYWGPKALVDRIVFKFIFDDDARLIALQRGDVDLAEQITGAGLPILHKDPKLQVFKTLRTFRDIKLYYNNKNWPMSDRRFRQALTMIVNFDKNVEVLRGEARRAKSFMAGSPWANDPEVGKLFPKYDVEKGKQLIKEVEKSAGKPIPELVYVSPNRDVYVKIANLHYAAYTAAGLKINLKIVDPTQWLRERDSGNYDITLAGGGGPGMDPLYQARMFGSSKDVGLIEKDGYNIPRYVNKEYDAIIRKAQSTEDRKVRAKLYQAAVPWRQQESERDHHDGERRSSFAYSGGAGLVGSMK